MLTFKISVLQCSSNIFWVQSPINSYPFKLCYMTFDIYYVHQDFGDLEIKKDITTQHPL